MRVASLQRRVLKHWWFLALCVVLACLGAGVNLIVLPTTYAVRTQLVLDMPSTALVASQQFILTQVSNATSETILSQAAQTLPGVKEATLAKEVSADAISGTSMFEVVVLDTNPARGAQIANAVAQQLVLVGYNSTARMNVAAQTMMQTNVDNAQHDLNEAKANLQSLRDIGASPQQVQAASATVDEFQLRYINAVQGMVDLQVQQSQTLYSLRIVTVASAETAEPHPSRTLVVGLALLIGLLVGIVGLVSSELFLAYFRPISDTEEAIPWESLGSVQVSGARGDALPADREGFEAVLRSVNFLNLAMAARHVAIIGIGRGDGASEVAAGLALASAASGQRTLLLDAAFPNGSQAQRFGVNTQPGLTEALLDARTHGDAAQLANFLQNSAKVSLPDLRLLTIGAAPKVAGRIAGTPALREQIYRLTQRLGASLSLVDVTAPGHVRQMAQLAAGADAVVVVIDLHTARRVDVARLEQALAEVQANVVGSIVARAASADASVSTLSAGVSRNVSRAVAP